MSYFDTRQALISRLINTSIAGITSDDISYENNNFNPQGKTKFIAAYFIPATSETTGKELAAIQERRGIFQISVYVKLDGGKYDIEQLQIVDSILAGFAYGSVEVYNNQTINILESSVNSGSENESWFKRDVSINYLTII
tara:strand:- start:9796 stop:10215 length:420 start_codon:yes stop_codon:yes gene_type:complete